MKSPSKWIDLPIAAALATVLELTPLSHAFYRYVYLPIFQEPQESLREAIQVVGWFFYLLVFWLMLQLISFLFGNPGR
jgi:uncharacterized membrane protein YdjX (TVP38/TMEM64 family)